MSPVKWDNPTPGQSPLIRHLLAVAHNPLMAELLECRDSGYALLEKHGHVEGLAADRVREKLKAVDAAYAAMGERTDLYKEQDQ